MKALVKAGSNAWVAEVPNPTVGKGEVLIRVRAAAFSRSDYKGGECVAAPDGVRGRGAKIVGGDMAGEVVAAGAGVQGFSAGERVCAVTSAVVAGAFAEYAVAKASRTAHLPESMSFEHGAALASSGTTAYASILKIPHLVSSNILVMGASGGVGQYCTLMAATKGAKVTAACGKGNAAIARECGAQRVLDYSTPGFLDEVADDAFDAAVVVNGRVSSSDYARVLKPGAPYIAVGIDSLTPSALSLPFRGHPLKAGLFFGVVDKQGLRRACDIAAASPFSPRIERVEGFDNALCTLVELHQRHPRGKVVVTLD